MVDERMKMVITTLLNEMKGCVCVCVQLLSLCQDEKKKNTLERGCHPLIASANKYSITQGSSIA